MTNSTKQTLETVKIIYYYYIFIKGNCISDKLLQQSPSLETITDILCWYQGSRETGTLKCTKMLILHTYVPMFLKQIVVETGCFA